MISDHLTLRSDRFLSREGSLLCDECVLFQATQEGRLMSCEEITGSVAFCLSFHTVTLILSSGVLELLQGTMYKTEGVRSRDVLS